MKKKVVINSILAAGAIAFAVAVPAFAESDPQDDAGTYSYAEGKASYQSRMAEAHPWFDDADETETAGYSYNAGSANAQARKSAFAGIPGGDDLSDEELDAFFNAAGVGGGAAYADGSYDESLKSGYGYTIGQAEYAASAASFAETVTE